MERQARGGREEGRIYCPLTLFYVRVHWLRCKRGMYACASSFLPFVISLVHNLLFHPKTIQNLMNAKASPRPFGVLPSASGPTLPPPSSRGIRSLPENLSFVTVGQFNVTLASPTLSLLFSISVGRG